MTEKTKMLVEAFKNRYPEHTGKFLATSKVGAVVQELPEVRCQPAVPSPVCLIAVKE